MIKTLTIILAGCILLALSPAQAQTVCGTPGNLTVTPISNGVLLTWDTVPGALAYKLQGGIVGIGGHAQLFTPKDTLRLPLLVGCKNFHWSVAAFCGPGNIGTFAIKDTFASPCPPCDAPTGLSTTNISAHSATMSWNSMANAHFYILEGKNTAWPAFLTVATRDTTVSPSYLPSGATFAWRVRSVCRMPFQLSGPSAIDTFSTPTMKTEPLVQRSLQTTVSPNPAANRVQVALSATGSQPAAITLNDLSGRRVLSQTHMLSTGINQIGIDVADVANGIYVLQVEADGISSLHKLIVNR